MTDTRAFNPVCYSRVEAGGGRKSWQTHDMAGKAVAWRRLEHDDQLGARSRWKSTVRIRPARKRFPQSDELILKRMWKFVTKRWTVEHIGKHAMLVQADLLHENPDCRNQRSASAQSREPRNKTEVKRMQTGAAYTN